MKLALVSVIIPCYNYGEFLNTTLESVLHQSYQNWECIIIDDGSSDNSKDVAQQYIERDERFKYKYQENAGLSAARNTGIDMAGGAYIQFLDADDLIQTHKLKTQVEFLESNFEFELVYGYGMYFGNSMPQEQYYSPDLTDRKWIPERIDGIAVQIDLLVRENIFAVSCPLVRKTLIDKTGSFNTKLTSLEDWEYWIRATLNKCLFAFNSSGQDETLIRIHDSSMSKNLNRMVENELIIRKEMHAFLPEDCRALNERCEKETVSEVIHYNKSRGFDEIHTGSLKVGLSHVQKALKYDRRFRFYFVNTLYWMKRRLSAS